MSTKTRTPQRIRSRFTPTLTSPATAKSSTVTPFQERVYSLLVQIPAGRVSSYALMARTLDSSPRAVGGALRNNPFAPEVPCHRVIAADGYVGGFKGEWNKAPSGINQCQKLELLREEGVRFTNEGKLMEEWRGGWDEFKVA